ncbi:hypothetical protein [Streptosporangium sp. NPDC006007]|uniref:hypothetical protein n=1 Tax=Streptosporangium sp. NPDC006007 TaxID=3154575 RepID=UPI0033A14E3B
MGLFSSKDRSKDEAREELKTAREELHAMTPRDTEDAEYWEKNGRVLAAEKNVPWYRR